MLKRVERFFYAYRSMVGMRWGAFGLAGFNGNVSTGLANPAYAHHPYVASNGVGSLNSYGDFAMSVRQYSRLRLVQAISQNDQLYSTKPVHQVGTGVVWGWRDSADAPLIIKLANGIHFACPGISNIARQSALAAGAIGQKVAFYHRGVDIQGKPISPLFKTLIIDGEG